MQGWGDQWEEDFGTKCQRWVVTRDSAWCCEHDGCNIAVFTRTLLSALHSPPRQNHLIGRKNHMVQPDSLNVGYNKVGFLITCSWIVALSFLPAEQKSVIGTRKACAFGFLMDRSMISCSMMGSRKHYGEK